MKGLGMKTRIPVFVWRADRNHLRILIWRVTYSDSYLMKCLWQKVNSGLNRVILEKNKEHFFVLYSGIVKYNFDVML